MEYDRNPWQNQFRTPTIKELRSGVRALDLKLFDRIRKRLTERQDLTETLEWFAEPWFWTLSYRLPGVDEPMAVIIPSAIDLQLAMPIDRELAEDLAKRPLRRSIQEGLSLVREPYHTRWCVWSLLGSAMVDDINDLLTIKQSTLEPVPA